jgi:transposase
VAQSLSCQRFPDFLGDAPRTIANWVCQFGEEGLAGLAEGERPGRPRRSDNTQLEEVGYTFRKSHAAYGLVVSLWDRKPLSQFVAKRWDITLGVRRSQRLFRQLGFRLRKLRPEIAHVDPNGQRENKKRHALARMEDVDLWATDEVHFQLYGSSCRMVIPM